MKHRRGTTKRNEQTGQKAKKSKAKPTAEPPPLPTRSLSMAQLYSARDEVRREEFLFSVAGNAVILNRVLHEEPTIDELAEKVEELDDTAFADRKQVREPTLRKVMTISATVAAMKQGFEPLAMLYPYSWVEREAEWLKGAYGVQMARRLIPEERRRLVPLIRRQVRSFQANLQRPLTEIEAALRPVEEIIARAGLQSHWASKLRRYLPGIAQGVLGASLVAIGAGAIGGRIVAGAVGMHGLGSILGHFESDRIAAAQLRHSAAKAFRWWQILMGSMSVSIYEAAEFVDGLSRQSMLRDRKIIDALPADVREAALRRLKEGLRKEYAADRRRRSTPVVEDGDMTWRDVSEDMRTYMREHLRSYVSAMAGRERLPAGADTEETDE